MLSRNGAAGLTSAKLNRGSQPSRASLAHPSPRSMTPRIHLALLLADLPNRIDPPGTNMRAPLNVRLLFVRKSRFLAGFCVNADNLADVLARGIYAFTAIPGMIE